MSKVAIIGYGFVGKAFHKMFPDAVIYDEPQQYFSFISETDNKRYILEKDDPKAIEAARSFVKQCDLAIVCVPTPMAEDGQCDISIVEDVVAWLETELIVIKSTIKPGTVDYLKFAYKKRICYSVETVGEGNYFIPYWKYPHATDPSLHSYFVIGGDEKDATEISNIYWNKLSPDLNIHIMPAIEAELTKYMLNSWGAMKVTFANEFYEICKSFGANYTNILQAWGADGRVEKMHMRVTPDKRGYGGKCFPKDISGIIEASKAAGYTPKLLEQVRESNKDFYNG